MELVSNDARVQKLINLTTFKYAKSYNENLSVITLEKKIIKFDKPIYVGMYQACLFHYYYLIVIFTGLAVLDISKTLMYDYHYNVMQKHYGDNIKLMYTDTGKIKTNILCKHNILIKIIITDSLVYFIQTDDFYDDLVKNNHMLDRMDTANLPRDHPCYIAERKKVPGLFSDETDGRIMTEFCALRAKSYAYKILGVDGINVKENIRAKGIRSHVVKNHMTFEGHRRCLFEGSGPYHENKHPNMCIRSFNHRLTTVKSNKITYNNYDDKRVVLEDKIHTLAHGHYTIE